ncbi:glycosyltransferase family 4 protein [Sulfurivermis fontis]|uniref:glycosyltransferase family 4 protein n=1 Tax=Sulfurivermis fontis TaxID=1972068 RepID=UPI000FD6D4F7|nr:glycosyltransferase family 1 protein [Sulfurivermis fontis]
MRVGVDGSVFVSKLTGIGNYSYRLLCAMARQAPEHEFIVFALQPLCVDFSEPNISIYEGAPSFVSNIYYWKAFGLARTVQRAKVDVFWASTGVAPFFMPCPVVLTVYDFVYRQAPDTMSFRGRWFRRVNQPWWIRRACGVFTIAQAVADEMLRYCARTADAIVRPAVDEALFFPRTCAEIESVKAKYNLSGAYNLIVGTLEPRKNIALFVREYLTFRRTYPDLDLPLLVLVGAKGWKDEEIVRLLDSAEAEGIVQRLGYVPTEDMPSLYSGADLFFMPSRYEGFGMPILEARRCGCPVVCSDVPAMHEAGGNHALYHAPTAEGIQWVLEELYLRSQRPHSDKALDVEWNWQIGAGQILSLLNSCGQVT